MQSQGHGIGMMIASSQSDRIASAARLRACRRVRGVFLPFLMIAALAGFNLANVAQAAEPSKTDAAMEDRVQVPIPELEAYIASGMKGFDVPGLAIGIVAGDKLVYAKGFGVRSKSGGVPVDTRTVFQNGSCTKAFLAATMAIMVDRGKFRWDDRVVDLDPDFQLKDPWVTREFRVFDLMAQRSGLPAYANDWLSFIFGFDEAALIRSLRYVDALGWVVGQMPNGNILWHDGGTPGFGSYIALVPDRNIGVIVLTNEDNEGFQDAIGLWTLDRILDDPNLQIS